MLRRHRVAMFGLETPDTVLFMDGCSAHHTQECEDTARQLGVQVECLPPNCTPSLQACDQYVNALFKQYYHDEWFEWYNRVGSRQRTKQGTTHSRLRKATEAEVHQWIANATARLIDSSPANATARLIGSSSASVGDGNNIPSAKFKACSLHSSAFLPSSLPSDSRQR